MKRRQIVMNAATTCLQIAGNAALLFFLYRFLVRAIGIQRLGVWSLVLATTSLVTLANQGFSMSIVKFVAKYAAHERPEEVSALIETALISVGITLGFLLVVLYPVAKWVLAIVLPLSSRPEAFAILPYALASLWINVTGSILQAGLTGHELITVCNYVDCGGSVLYLFLAFLFVPTTGLLGLGYAQVAQAGFCAAALWILLKRRVPLAAVPMRWSRTLFREMLGYGVNFQLITASQAIREPVTKALITKFGGPAMTGLYDMASRCVVTVRELIVQANQVLIPTVSGLQERDPALIPAVYGKSYRLIFFLAIPAFALVVIVSPIVSLVWLGTYEPAFVEFVILLAAAWLVNVLSNPAYVVDLGTGSLRWVSIGCAATAVLNVTFGIAGGVFFGGTGVVVASVSSLIAGYTLVVAAYHIQNQLSFWMLLPAESIVVLAAGLLALLIFFPFFRASDTQLLSARTLAGFAAALCTIVAPMWLHPMRKRVVSWVLSRTTA